MTNEEMNIAHELEQLRKDYAQLKQELGKQEITNERLIRESIRKDLSFIDKKKWIGIPAIIIVAVLMPYISKELGLRTTFVIITIVWIAILAIANFIRMNGMYERLISMMPTQEFLKRIKKQKQQQFRWFQINIPLLFLWVGYFIGECIHANLPQEILYSLLGGLITGLVIGGTIGLRMHNRIIGIYEGIILQLENPEAGNYTKL